MRKVYVRYGEDSAKLEQQMENTPDNSFVLNIELGQNGTVSPNDVADALLEVCSLLRAGNESGVIYNSEDYAAVGHYHFNLNIE